MTYTITFKRLFRGEWLTATVDQIPVSAVNGMCRAIGAGTLVVVSMTRQA